MRINLSRKLLLLASLVLLFGAKVSTVSAQSNLPEVNTPAESARPPVEPIQPETLPEEQAPPLEIDPALSDPDLQTTEESIRCLPLIESEETTFTAVKIDVIGSTVLQDEISQLVGCYEGQNITLSDLFNLRSQITQLYIDNDYVTSGAFIPNNQIIGDQLQVQVIEGSLEDIQINGLSRLREGYVRSRLNRSTQTPLNQQTLTERLQLLQQDPNLSRVNAELTAGTSPGESLLILDLQEPNPFSVLVGSDNLRSPSIGATGLNLSTSYRNLLGFGDTLSASYGKTEGLDLYDFSFAVPVNAADGTLTARYTNSGSRIVENTFEDVGIRSNTETISVGFRQPLIQTPSQEFALWLDFDWRSSQSFILEDVPFSFSIGPENGRSQVSALRFSQDWTQRGPNRVLAARSQFSLGLDAFGATINDTGTDGQFFSWLGQFQWVEQVTSRTLSLIKFNTQLTGDSLLPLERFSLGGIGTVRGYSQNQLVADNAINASAELRIPITRDANVLQVTPFLETGYGWNNQTDNPANNFLLGTGVGLRWQATPNFFLRTDYGIPLVNSGDRGSSLQDNGFYFSITYQPN